MEEIEYVRIEYHEINRSEMKLFLSLLQDSYGDNYGSAYHSKRIEDNRCIIILGRNSLTHEIVSGCYVKPNGRRCATVVKKQYQHVGNAVQLIGESLKYLNKQYSVVPNVNSRITNALIAAGFSRVKSVSDIEIIAPHECNQFILDGFREPDFTFSRRSFRRSVITPDLVMLQIGFLHA